MTDLDNEQARPTKKQSKSKPTRVDHEQQIGELTAHLQRLQAEFENYKKRAVTERSELMDMAKQSVLSELLPALDNFDRAATHLPAELSDNAWAKGMSYVGAQLEQILDSMGVKKFVSLGQPFDHHRHEAMEYVSSEGPPDVVVEELTPGYEINGKVVRPATVKVSQADTKTNQNDTNQDLEQGEQS